MFGIGSTELLVIGLVMLVLFGHRLPAIMFDMGRAVTQFKQGIHACESDDAADSSVRRTEKA